MADETVINILCEVASGECVPYDAEPRIVKAMLAMLREHGQRTAIASGVFYALIQGAAANDSAVPVRRFAKVAVQAADILLEELTNG